MCQAPATNRPPAMVPIRIAMKVAPSTSALPVASSPTCELVGQDGVFHRAEQRGDDAEQAERHEQQRDRMQEEAGGRKAGGEYLGELQPPRDGHLDVFVGQFAAEGRQNEKRKDEDRAGERHQRVACPAAAP